MTQFDDQPLPAQKPAVRYLQWQLVVLLIVAGLAAFGPMLFQFFKQQWQKPEYQAFPLILAAMAYFFWERSSQVVFRPSAVRLLLAALITMVASAILAWSTYIFSPWLSMFSCILFLGVIPLLWRPATWDGPSMLGPWALSWLLLPLPMSYDTRLITFLQLQSSRFSSFLLDSLGVLHIAQGNVLELPDRSFFVDEACSGIVSLISIVTCIAIYCVWQGRRWSYSAILIAVGIGCATLMNTGRIIAVAMAHSWWGWDLASGAPHTVLGLVLFAITTFVLIFIDYLLLEFLRPIAPAENEWEFRTGKILIRIWDRWIAVLPEDFSRSHPSDTPNNGGGIGSSLVVQLLVVPLVVVAAGQWTWGRLERPELVIPTTLAVDEIQQQDLPATIGPLQQSKFREQSRDVKNVWGQFSKTYAYLDQNNWRYIVSLDYFFGPGWHDVSNCYALSGWKILSHRVENLGEDDWNHIAVSMYHPDTREHGELRFSIIGLDGAKMPVLAKPKLDLRTITRRLFFAQAASDYGYFSQVQALVVSPAEITDEQKANLELLMQSARARLRQRIEELNQRPGTTKLAQH